MLMGNDFDLNSSQRFPDSMKEVLKQTMLNQEVIFRTQVHELHRLYAIQKSLMKGDGCGLDHFAHQIRYDLLAMEKTFPRIPMVVSKQSAVDSNYLREGRVIYSRLQQRPLDLQPPTVNCMNYICGDLLKWRNDQNSGQSSAKLKHYFGDYNVSYQEEVNLSLSIGRANRRESIGGKTWNNKKTYPFSQVIIDLEESTETTSDEEAKPVFSLGCTAPITSVNEHNMQVCGQSSRNFAENLMKDLSHGMPDTSIDGSELCQEWSSLNQGSNEWHGDLPCNDTNVKGAKQFTSYEVADFDLNKNQPDEKYSFYSKDPLGNNPSLGVFCSLIGKCNEGSCSTPVCFRQSNSNEKTAIDAAFTTSIGSKACTIDLESMPGPSSSDLSEDPFNCKHQNIELPLSSQEDRDMPEVNREEGKEDSVTSHPNSKCPVTWKFDCAANDHSSSIKNVQSGTDLGEPNLSTSTVFQSSKSSQVVETLCQHCEENKEGSAEVDYLVQKAAFSLICISLQGSSSSTSDQDCITKSGSNQIENEKGKRPQCSLDSYESLVLKLEESSIDDCVSSKAFEINEMDTKKDSPIKLRRGSRLKDFQKDILPTLSSLSRHEIWEDINIMEGVIRSREYKRLRAKAGNAEKWFTPVRSRRSRLNYVG